MTKLEKKLVRALKIIVDTYVANQGTNSEFITCITPNQSWELTPSQRKRDKYWKMFDNARKIIKEAECGSQ